jgi:Papain family cysteine protease
MATPWRFYSSGVIRNDCTPATNHAVLAVGLIGDHYLIKNSWGAGWGDQGYVRIGREEGPGICGINLIPSRPFF